MDINEVSDAIRRFGELIEEQEETIKKLNEKIEKLEADASQAETNVSALAVAIHHVISRHTTSPDAQKKLRNLCDTLEQKDFLTRPAYFFQYL